MEKIVLVLLVLLHYLLILNVHLKQGRPKAERNSTRHRMTVVWLKDWLLTPLILLSVLHYLFFSQTQAWTFVTFPANNTLKIMGGLIIIMGFVLKLLAYDTLGRNWSAKVNVYADHELISTGPYRIFRHPVYISYLLTFTGYGILSGNALFIFFAFAYHTLNSIRAKQEEKMLLDKFGEKYQNYLQETNMCGATPLMTFIIICNIFGAIDEVIYWPLTGNSFTFNWGYRAWLILFS